MRVHSGTAENVVISEEEGGIVAWQTLQTDNDGQVCLFRIIKRSLLPEDEGFTESLLCNRKSFGRTLPEISNCLQLVGFGYILGNACVLRMYGTKRKVLTEGPEGRANGVPRHGKEIRAQFHTNQQLKMRQEAQLFSQTAHPLLMLTNKGLKIKSLARLPVRDPERPVSKLGGRGSMVASSMSRLPLSHFNEPSNPRLSGVVDPSPFKTQERL